MQKEKEAVGRFQVLSLDGGGLKGLFTAAYLAEWEAHTRRPVAAAMDLIAGTSVGGIIALGLGAGYSAQQLLDFFREHADAIFPKERFDAMGQARQAVRSRYDAGPLRLALENRFGNLRLGDSSTRLIVPAYHVEAGIYLYKTSHHPRLRMDWRQPMTVIARATSAAPTFLPPVVLEPGLRLIDGGVWANNPVQVAVTESLGYLDQRQDSIAALRISPPVEVIAKASYPDDPGAVGLDTLKLFADVTMRAQSQAASGAVRQLLGPDRFVEVTPQVAPSEYRLDRLSEDLIGMAKAVFRRTVSDLGDKGFLDHLAAPFSPFHCDAEERTHG